MSQAARRIYFIDLVNAEGELEPERADAFMKRMGSVLTEVGGSLVLTAEREQIAQLDGEPVAVTTQIVARWDSFSPLKQPEPAPAAEPAAPDAPAAAPVVEG